MSSVAPRKTQLSFGSGTYATLLELRVADEGISFEEWAATLRRVLSFADASQWWVGDLLAHGEWKEEWRDDYRRVLEELELKYDLVRDWIYVARNVPPPARRDDLSWRHHRAVAKLIPPEQIRWLAETAEKGWSYRQLALEIAARAADPEPPGDSGSLPEPPGHAGDLVDFPLEQLHLTYERERVERWRDAAHDLDVELQDWIGHVLDKETAAP